jgi:hypothetical protein
MTPAHSSLESGKRCTDTKPQAVFRQGAPVASLPADLTSTVG